MYSPVAAARLDSFGAPEHGTKYASLSSHGARDRDDHPSSWDDADSNWAPSLGNLLGAKGVLKKREIPYKNYRT